MIRMACDVDLRKIYCVCSTCGVVADKHDAWTAVRLHANEHYNEGVTVLCEVAGAVDYTDNKAVAHNKRRWTIWNIAMVSRLHEQLSRVGIPVLVSPSSKWTQGHDVKVRHQLAACDAKNKDLKECQAMLWFAARAADSWIPFQSFLDHL